MKTLAIPSALFLSLALTAQAQAASLADPSSLAGDHALLAGEADCPASLDIRTEATADGVNLFANGATISAYFYRIDGEGGYSFNSSTSRWTYARTTYVAAAGEEALVRRVARAYFVRPLRVMAREESRLTLRGAELTLATTHYSAAANGAALISCTFQAD